MRASSYTLKLYELLQVIGCTSLREIYPQKITVFLKAAIEKYLDRSLPILDLAHLCEDMLDVIPINQWYRYEELELILRIADLAWYLIPGNERADVVNQTLKDLRLFVRQNVGFD